MHAVAQGARFVSPHVSLCLHYLSLVSLGVLIPPSGLEQNSGLISLDLGTAPTAASAACIDVSAARQVSHLFITNQNAETTCMC